MIKNWFKKLWMLITNKKPQSCENVKTVHITSILVIEDDSITSKIICAKLKSMNIKSITAVNSAYEAISFLAKNQVEMIITDWDMPWISGLELIQKLRKNPEYNNVPIIMLTGFGQPEDCELILKTGATKYLIKPISMSVLEMNIIWCQMWRLEREFKKLTLNIKGGDFDEY